MYSRVVPRDLFNEAKLLKSLGQLCLLIHDGVDKWGNPTPRHLNFRHEGERFVIDQRQSCGGLYVTAGLQFTVRSHVLELYSAYNDKSEYPLLCMTHEGEEIEVLDHDGTLSEDFCCYVEYLAIVGREGVEL